LSKNKEPLEYVLIKAFYHYRKREQVSIKEICPFFPLSGKRKSINQSCLHLSALRTSINQYILPFVGRGKGIDVVIMY
jgi:hypothetical protein